MSDLAGQDDHLAEERDNGGRRQQQLFPLSHVRADKKVEILPRRVQSVILLTQLGQTKLIVLLLCSDVTNKAKQQ
jgi:hypothetical protein